MLPATTMARAAVTERSCRPSHVSGAVPMPHSASCVERPHNANMRMHQRHATFRRHDQDLRRDLPFREVLFGRRQFHDMAGRILERDELAAARKRDRIFEAAQPSRRH
jgi:hypothetical protein